MMEKCGRCGEELPESECETCWFCTKYLCFECWDKFGHCGHKEASAFQNAARLRIVSGENYILPLDGVWTSYEVDNLQNRINEFFPGCKILVVVGANIPGVVVNNMSFTNCDCEKKIKEELDK